MEVGGRPENISAELKCSYLETSRNLPKISQLATDMKYFLNCLSFLAPKDIKVYYRVVQKWNFFFPPKGEAQGKGVYFLSFEA